MLDRGVIGYLTEVLKCFDEFLSSAKLKQSYFRIHPRLTGRRCNPIPVNDASQGSYSCHGTLLAAIRCYTL